MQRVTRDSVIDREVLNNLESRVELIRKYFPPSIANLYGKPRVGADGTLEWWSELMGQPVLFHDLNKDQQRQLLEKYQQRQTGVHYLAKELSQRRQVPVSDGLLNLVGSPDLDNLYSINGEPLVIRWHLRPPEPPPLEPPKKKQLWLLLFLIPLLLGLGWWFWYGNQIVSTIENSLPSLAKLEVPREPETLPELEEIPPELEPIPPELEPIPPELEPIPPELEEILTEPEPIPPPPEPEIPPPFEPKLLPKPKPLPKTELPAKSVLSQPSKTTAKKKCLKKPGEPPTQFTVILDTSGSMKMNLNVTHQDEDWYFQEDTEKLPDSHPRKVRITSEPTRLSLARKSLTDMINNLQQDIDVRLITFGKGCGGVPDHGIFNHAQRSALIGKIVSLKPEGATPLAASLVAAANRMDGQQRDAIVLMFIDGEENCDGNVCAVANWLAKEKPRLKVNVVNINSRSVKFSNCITKSTGGQIYSTDNAVEVAAILKEATQEISQDSICD